MHYIGVKCDICSNIANAEDSIEDVPRGWLAVVPHYSCGLFTNARKEALHFCSFKCLQTWTEKQIAKEKTT
jgi:hypothetical protein